jgi:hypothetical protein
MLQITAEIPGVSNRRPDHAVTVAAAASRCAAAGMFPASKHRIDRKNNANSPCNRVGHKSITEHRLTCEFSSSDAELQQYMGKGGAPFIRRSPLRTLHRMGDTTTGFTFCSLSSSVKEGGNGGSYKSGISGRRPSEGEERIQQRSSAANTGANPGPRARVGQPSIRVDRKGGITNLSVKEVNHV